MEFEFTDSESDIKIRKFPSLLHGKRSAPELPLLPPASVLHEDSSPGKRGRKPKAPVELSSSFSAEGSDEERWIRRRSERIFLHDAAQAKPISPSKPTVPKPARGPKAPLHGSKDMPKTKEVKALGKVGAGLLMCAELCMLTQSTAQQQEACSICRTGKPPAVNALLLDTKGRLKLARLQLPAITVPPFISSLALLIVL